MEAGRDGLHQGILDDVLLIDHVINWAPDRAQICCWACWAQIFISKTMYYTRYYVITYNKMLYLGIGRWEWVDVAGWVQMTTSQLGRCCQLGHGFAVGLVGLRFSQQKKCITIDIVNSHTSI